MILDRAGSSPVLGTTFNKNLKTKTMSNTGNIPYIHQKDENGETLNPITKDSPIITYGNRKQYREDLKAKGNPWLNFMGNKKANKRLGIPTCLTVLRTGKYLRFRQFIKMENGKTKVIHHYILQ